RTAGSGRLSRGRLCGSSSFGCSDEPLRGASRSALVRRSTGVSPRTMAYGGCSASKVRIFSIRRWRTRLYRRTLRMDGRRPDTGHARAALAATPGTWTSGGDACPDYVAAETRDANDPGEAHRLKPLKKGTG